MHIDTKVCARCLIYLLWDQLPIDSITGTATAVSASDISMEGWLLHTQTQTHMHADTHNHSYFCLCDWFTFSHPGHGKWYWHKVGCVLVKILSEDDMPAPRLHYPALNHLSTWNDSRIRTGFYPAYSKAWSWAGAGGGGGGCYHGNNQESLKHCSSWSGVFW